MYCYCIYMDLCPLRSLYFSGLLPSPRSSLGANSIMNNCCVSLECVPLFDHPMKCAVVGDDDCVHLPVLRLTTMRVRDFVCKMRPERDSITHRVYEDREGEP